MFIQKVTYLQRDFIINEITWLGSCLVYEKRALFERIDVECDTVCVGVKKESVIGVGVIWQDINKIK